MYFDQYYFININNSNFKSRDIQLNAMQSYTNIITLSDYQTVLEVVQLQ